MGILLDTIATAGTVKRLVLERTLLKSKSKEGLVAGCARILRAPNSVLESLSVADCGLRDAVVPLLHAAGASTTLSEIDVSGNAAGDAGASALAASLYVTPCALRCGARRPRPVPELVCVWFGIGT